MDSGEKGLLLDGFGDEEIGQDGMVDRFKRMGLNTIFTVLTKLLKVHFCKDVL